MSEMVLPPWLFLLAHVLRLVVPCAVAAAAVCLPHPRHRIGRGVAATLLGWVVGVILTAEVYNPIAIACSPYDEDARMRFDNNRVAVEILIGWVYPAFTVVITLLAADALRRRGSRADERFK